MHAKTCIDCGQSKEIDEFSKNDKFKDGYYPYCKSCHDKRHDYKRILKYSSCKKICRSDSPSFPGCNRNLPLSFFIKNYRNADGLDSLCCTCRNILRRRIREQNAETYRETARKYYFANAERIRVELKLNKTGKGLRKYQDESKKYQDQFYMGDLKFADLVDILLK